MEKMRDSSIDFAKGVGILAVTFVHICSKIYGGGLVSQYFGSFKIAVFFVASGYLRYGRAEHSPGVYISRLARTVLYPYCTMSVLLFLLGSVRMLWQVGCEEFVRQLPVSLSEMMTWGKGAMWFLPTFFLSGVIAYACRYDKHLSLNAKIVWTVVSGSLLCLVTERYGTLKDVNAESIRTLLFWLWHLFSYVSRSILGSSLVLIGYAMKKYWPTVEKYTGGGIEYFFCLRLVLYAH